MKKAIAALDKLFADTELHRRNEPASVEQIRELIHNMSDAELRKYGRAAKDLSDPKKNFGPRNPAFQVQVDEARAEWRRRHPAAAGRRNPKIPGL